MNSADRVPLQICCDGEKLEQMNILLFNFLIKTIKNIHKVRVIIENPELRKTLMVLPV